MDVPHILSNQAEKYVMVQSAHSVFCIRCIPRGMKFSGDESAQDSYVTLMKRLVSKRDKKQKSTNTWSNLDKASTNGTGFAYEVPTDDGLVILTAAHLIKDVYREQCPLDDSHLIELNQAYCFEVMCIHLGRICQASGQGADGVDKYLPAIVVGIDSRVDLMALKVSHEQLSLLCKENHITIRGIAELPPRQGERVLLQAWPENKFDTSLWGIVSSTRSYKWMTDDNPYGYKMDVTEVPELDVEPGCSGGPLVDGRVKCVGLLHATVGYCGYAVGVSDIRKFLARSGLMVDPQNTVAAAAAAAAAAREQESKSGHERAVGKGLQRRHEDNNAGHELAKGNRYGAKEGSRRRRAGVKEVQEEERGGHDEDDDDEEDSDEEWLMKKDDKGRGRGRGRGRVGRGGR